MKEVLIPAIHVNQGLGSILSLCCVIKEEEGFTCRGRFGWKFELGEYCCVLWALGDCWNICKRIGFPLDQDNWRLSQLAEYPTIRDKSIQGLCLLKLLKNCAKISDLPFMAKKVWFWEGFYTFTCLKVGRPALERLILWCFWFAISSIQPVRVLVKIQKFCNTQKSNLTLL